MAKDYSYGCPVCGEWPAGADHQCKPSAIKRHERELIDYQAELEREPEREFGDKLDEAERIKKGLLP